MALANGIGLQAGLSRKWTGKRAAFATHPAARRARHGSCSDSQGRPEFELPL